MAAGTEPFLYCLGLHLDLLELIGFCITDVSELLPAESVGASWAERSWFSTDVSISDL